MRVLLMISVVMCALFTASCATEASEPNDPGEAAPVPSDRPSANPTGEAPALSERSQAVCSECSCPRGQRCYSSGECGGFAVFGPAPAPPLSPACVCDSQCPPERFCDYSIGSYGAGYGYCSLR